MLQEKQSHHARHGESSDSVERVVTGVGAAPGTVAQGSPQGHSSVRTVRARLIRDRTRSLMLFDLFLWKITVA